jgi:hypothetical protein
VTTAENGEHAARTARLLGCARATRDETELTMQTSVPARTSALASSALALAFIAQPLPSRAADAPAHSACAAADYHRLDFWIGDWDTFETDAANGTSIARANVEPIAEGCALHELYRQSDGLIGDSILSFDPVRKRWQQTWVTNRGSLMVITGTFEGGALVLEGEAHLADGRSVVQRITWKAEGDGVRESAVLSKDDGHTWTPAFDVVFRRHPAAAP